MDPKTLQLILFAEEMAALAAKTIADVRAVVSATNAQNIDQILDDADRTYQSIILKAKTGQ